MCILEVDVGMTGFVYHVDQRYVSKCMITTKIAKTEVSQLEFNVPFQHKYGYIRDEAKTETRLNKFLAEPSFKLHSGQHTNS